MLDDVRTQLIHKQRGSVCEGTVDKIGGEWVFFENTTDEASMLQSILSYSPHIQKHDYWLPLEQFQAPFFTYKNLDYSLEPGDAVRFYRPLSHTLVALLAHLSDVVFIGLLTFLNENDYSIFDCIYCHYFGGYFHHSRISDGVNFLIFDNTTILASLHHTFTYTEKSESHHFQLLSANGNSSQITYNDRIG
ncbi:MAG: DUF2777 family protein [Bacilli bacterium]